MIVRTSIGLGKTLNRTSKESLGLYEMMENKPWFNAEFL